jgi:y4mF family transcriptional regulator
MDSKFKLSFIIKYHRKQLGLSQKQLADLAGVGKTVIFDLEKGKDTVGFNIICGVLNALKIKVNLESPLLVENIKLKL